MYGANENDIYNTSITTKLFFFILSSLLQHLFFISLTTTDVAMKVFQMWYFHQKNGVKSAYCCNKSLLQLSYVILQFAYVTTIIDDWIFLMAEDFQKKNPLDDFSNILNFKASIYPFYIFYSYNLRLPQATSSHRSHRFRQKRTKCDRGEEDLKKLNFFCSFWLPPFVVGPSQFFF